MPSFSSTDRRESNQIGRGLLAHHWSKVWIRSGIRVNYSNHMSGNWIRVRSRRNIRKASWILRRPQRGWGWAWSRLDDLWGDNFKRVKTQEKSHGGSPNPNIQSMARLPLSDILHRGVVYSLAGLSVYAVAMSIFIHRDTMQRGRGAWPP